MAAQLSHMLWKNNPVLRQQPTNLVDQLCPAADKSRPHPMQALQILLLDSLGRNEAHARPADSFADRLRIVGVVLLRLHIGLHELRRDQAYRVPQSAQHSKPVVRSTASLQSYQARFDFSKERRHLGSS